MTYHWGCNKSNRTGVTSGAEIHIVVVGQGITVIFNDLSPGL